MTKKYIKIKRFSEIKKTINENNVTLNGAYFNPSMTLLCDSVLEASPVMPFHGYYQERANQWDWHRDWFDYCDENGNILPEGLTVEDCHEIAELDEMLFHFLNLRGI